MLATRTKRAVLVGCNYPNTQFKLHGCINDVNCIRDLIVGKLGFAKSDVQVLTDAPGSSILPTGANIKDALNRMLNNAKPGDVLFFYFSGHGTNIPIFQPGQPFKEDEAIVACDLNLITDVDFRLLVNLLPEGVSFTILSDSCHSGGLIEKEKEQIGKFNRPKGTGTGTAKAADNATSKGISFSFIHDIINITADIAHDITKVGEKIYGIFGKDVSFKFHPDYVNGSLDLVPLKDDEGILLSGCEANERSFDLVLDGKAYGAFTHAVINVLNQNNTISNKQLVLTAAKDLKNQTSGQDPCLYCSDKNANAPFLDGPA